MPRLLGVDIPNNKPTLDFVDVPVRGGAEDCARAVPQGGSQSAGSCPGACARTNWRGWRRLLDKDYTVEGQLRRQVKQNIARLRDINCYRGIRHRRGLAGARPADADQRPHPQGPEEDRGRQEGREGPAVGAEAGLRQSVPSRYRKPVREAGRRRVGRVVQRVAEAAMEPRAKSSEHDQVDQGV